MDEITRQFNAETQSIVTTIPQGPQIKQATIQSLIDEINRQDDDEVVENERHIDVIARINEKRNFAQEELTWALAQPGAIDPRV